MSRVLKDITEECVTQYDPEWGYVVTYKGVALWMTIYPDDPKDIEGNTIQLVDGDEDEPLTILGKTPVEGFEGSYDYSTYGDWDTLEEALEWLENPVALY